MVQDFKIGSGTLAMACYMERQNHTRSTYCGHGFAARYRLKVAWTHATHRPASYSSDKMIW